MRTRVLPSAHPWPQPVTVGIQPSDCIGGYTTAQMIEMYYRRRSWSAKLRWTAMLQPDPDALVHGPSPDSPPKPPRGGSWSVTAMQPPTYASGYGPQYPGAELDPGDNAEGILYYNQAKPCTGGAFTDDFIPATSARWRGAMISTLWSAYPDRALLGSGGHGLGPGVDAYYAATPVDLPWMGRSGNLFYPAVCNLGWFEIGAVAGGVNLGREPVDPTADPTTNPESWPALSHYGWPHVLIIVSDRELSFEGLTDGSVTYPGLSYRGKCTGTMTIDGQSAAAYAVILEDTYVQEIYDTGTGTFLKYGTGLPQMQLPDDSQPAFSLDVGWIQDIEPSAADSEWSPYKSSGGPAPPWYQYAGASGPIYDQFTGEVILTDAAGNPVSPEQASLH